MPPYIQTMTSNVSEKLLKESISKFEYVLNNYSPQQKEIIWGQKNNLTIGRSGTGKTQSCVFQLLAAELLAKRLKIKTENKKAKFTADKVLENSGLMNIYIAASGFLSDEVKGKYTMHLS